ncbi:MAG TPA: hypothetical protein VFQ30_00905 [Ktedonobacteraceae bacterium]|nr:hypothetical protein [Ktedonobacteraceae bacterium]
METLRVGKAPAEPAASVDASWRNLYRVGGICAMLAGALYIAALALDFIVPPAPLSGGAATLQYIASHRSFYIIEQTLWLVPGVLLMVTFLAIPMALKHLNKSYVAIGALIGVASWALSLAWPTTGGGGHALVYLSDQYVVATSAAQRAAFAAAAEGFIAQNTIPTIIGILQPIGILILSLVMLKGVFHKGVASLGIVTGLLGMVSETLRPIMGLSYAVYGVLLILWFLVIGWNLFWLASSRSQSLIGKKLEVGAVS